MTHLLFILTINIVLFALLSSPNTSACHMCLISHIHSNFLSIILHCHLTQIKSISHAMLHSLFGHLPTSCLPFDQSLASTHSTPPSFPSDYLNPFLTILPQFSLLSLCCLFILLLSFLIHFKSLSFKLTTVTRNFVLC